MAANPIVSELVATRRTAALGTLHRGAPFVSMVPFAVLPDGSAIVIHVSRLAAHTNDMLASPAVSLLISAPENEGTPPQALPRITIEGEARQLAGGEAETARDAYLARFPDSAPIFGLGDFSLFAIVPRSVRVIGGFGSATTNPAADFALSARA